MTEQEKDTLREEILEQLRFDAALIEELTPVNALKADDKFEIDGGRYVNFSRLISEIRLEQTLDTFRHVDRGQWKEGEMYYAGDNNPYTGLVETSHVWYCGCKFRCLVTGTKEPPRWDSPDWEFEEGDASFQVYFTGGPSAVPPRSFKFTLTIHAKKYRQDVTGDILPQDVAWTRYSEDKDGNERVASDIIWATKRGGSGLQITLTEDDIDALSLGVPKVCIFTATVTLRDGEKKSATLTI